MLKQTTRSFSDMDAGTWYAPDVFALAEAGVVNKAGLSQLGVLLPQGLKQLPSDSEAAERKNLKTEKLIFSNFFGQMSEANEYQVVLRESFEKVSRTNGLRGVKIEFYRLRSDK